MRHAFLFFVKMAVFAVFCTSQTWPSSPQKNSTYNFTLNDLLFKAITNKDLPRLQILLAQRADPNARNEQGTTALMEAIQSGHTKYLGGTKLVHTSMVRALIKAGADVNARDRVNQTPLMHACLCCHATVVKILLDAGADTTLKDAAGMTALDYTSGNPAVHKMVEKFEKMQSIKSKENMPTSVRHMIIKLENLPVSEQQELLDIMGNYFERKNVISQGEKVKEESLVAQQERVEKEKIAETIENLRETHTNSNEKSYENLHEQESQPCSEPEPAGENIPTNSAIDLEIPVEPPLDSSNIVEAPALVADIIEPHAVVLPSEEVKENGELDEYISGPSYESEKDMPVDSDREPAIVIEPVQEDNENNVLSSIPLLTLKDWLNDLKNIKPEALQPVVQSHNTLEPIEQDINFEVMPEVEKIRDIPSQQIENSNEPVLIQIDESEACAPINLAIDPTMLVEHEQENNNAIASACLLTCIGTMNNVHCEETHEDMFCDNLEDFLEDQPIDLGLGEQVLMEETNAPDVELIEPPTIVELKSVSPMHLILEIYGQNLIKSFCLLTLTHIIVNDLHEKQLLLESENI